MTTLLVCYLSVLTSGFLLARGLKTAGLVVVIAVEAVAGYVLLLMVEGGW